MHQPDTTTPASHHQWLLPSPGLRPWVACYLITSNDGPTSEGFPRVHTPPMNAAVMQIHLDTPPLRDDGTGTWQRVSQVLVMGPKTGPRVDLNDASAGSTLSVCFQPAGWYRIIQDAPSMLGHKVAAAGDVMRGHADDLASRLKALPRRALIARVEDWLEQRLRHTDPPSKQATWLRQRLTVDSLGDVARDMGISQRQLTRRTRNLLGIRPKEYQRIARLHRFGELYRAWQSMDQQVSGADIAAALDYFDESHFARDIRDLTGRSPSQLIKGAPELDLYHQPPPVPLF